MLLADLQNTVNQSADIGRDERRAHQRFPVQLPIVLTSAFMGGEAEGVTRDVSAKGVFFYTSAARLKVAVAIAFKMLLPAEITGTDNTRVACKGKIVRVEEEAGGRMGVAATIDRIDFGRDRAPTRA
jgi:PilZ domain